MTDYLLADRHACSVARAIDALGDTWSLLVLREMFLGAHRFDQLQEHLGIARNILAARLRRLVDGGILEKRQYAEHPPRFEYHLTAKGIDLYPVIIALMQWGDRYVADAPGGPIVLEHKVCGHLTSLVAACAECGAPVTAREMRARRRAG
ncbi:MAG TPA: helix-turn-helix domain-containing protein [Chloroflexota bacterium]|jgi:DNA-binding HxlR family transcriptional regulator